jgi:hypothetical protein
MELLDTERTHSESANTGTLQLAADVKHYPAAASSEQDRLFAEMVLLLERVSICFARRVVVARVHDRAARIAVHVSCIHYAVRIK